MPARGAFLERVMAGKRKRPSADNMTFGRNARGKRVSEMEWSDPDYNARIARMTTRLSGGTHTFVGDELVSLIRKSKPSCDADPVSQLDLSALDPQTTSVTVTDDVSAH